MPIAVIHALDHEGQGVSRSEEGKTLFIEGALPGETVEYEITREKPRFAKGMTTRVLKRSSMRVEPRCEHFSTCGGCSIQHLDSSAQPAIKQRVLEDALWHQARLKPEIIYPAIAGPDWEYRYRARLSVRRVERFDSVLLLSAAEANLRSVARVASDDRATDSRGTATKDRTGDRRRCDDSCLPCD